MKFAVEKLALLTAVSTNASRFMDHCARASFTSTKELHLEDGMNVGAAYGRKVETRWRPDAAATSELCGRILGRYKTTTTFRGEIGHGEFAVYYLSRASLIYAGC